MLRDFVPEDREDFIRFSKEFYTTGAVLHAVPESVFHTTFDTILAGSPYARGFLFQCDGENAGYALLSFTYSGEVGGLVVLLEEAFILSKFQGRGLGSELFQFVEQEYRGKARRLRLEVTRSNVGAIRLYERMGFAPLDYLQMVKEMD